MEGNSWVVGAHPIESACSTKDDDWNGETYSIRSVISKSTISPSSLLPYQNNAEKDMSIAMCLVCQDGIVLGCDSRIIVSKDTPYAKAGTYDDGEKFLLYKNYGVTCCGGLDASFNGEYITWKDIVKSAIDSESNYCTIIDKIVSELTNYNMMRTQMIIANALSRKITKIEFNVETITLSSKIIGQGHIQACDFLNPSRILNDFNCSDKNIVFSENFIRFYINKNIEVCNLLSEFSHQKPVIGGKARTVSLCFDGSCKIDGISV